MEQLSIHQLLVITVAAFGVMRGLEWFVTLVTGKMRPKQDEPAGPAVQSRSCALQHDSIVQGLESLTARVKLSLVEETERHVALLQRYRSLEEIQARTLSSLEANGRMQEALVKELRTLIQAHTDVLREMSTRASRDMG